MNTPTPRTDAAWSATFDGEQMSAGRTARALLEHSQQLETELAALTAERDQLRVDLELADVMYQRECEVEHELRTEVERLRSDRDCEKRLRKDADEFMENAIERATKAEADLVALEQSFDDNCRGVVRIADELATERARLDWLLLDVVSRFDDAYYTRTTIDAAMKEDAK